MTPLYHGTARPFTKGGLVMPVRFHREQCRPGNTATDYAYATTDYEMAKWYAFQAKGRAHPRVLTVEALGPVEADPSTYDDERGHQVRCKDGFVVVAVEKFTPAEAAWYRASCLGGTG